MEGSKLVEMYTDGSSRGNPGRGGYGVVLMCEKHKLYKELSKGYEYTTNNRMELLAVIEGLKVLKKPKTEILIYSDSKYVVDTVERGWLWKWEKKDFKGKKNVDLWKEFIPLYLLHDVEFQWVKGHSDNIWNEKCDELATKAADGDGLIKDKGFSY